MKSILKYKEYGLMNEELTNFRCDQIVSLKLTEDDGSEIHLKTCMTELTYSIFRTPDTYKFQIIDTDCPEKYPKESEMYFPLDFNHKTIRFIFNIRSYNSTHTDHTMIERHYQAKVDIESVD